MYVPYVVSQRNNCWWRNKFANERVHTFSSFSALNIKRASCMFTALYVYSNLRPSNLSPCHCMLRYNSTALEAVTSEHFISHAKLAPGWALIRVLWPVYIQEVRLKVVGGWSFESGHSFVRLWYMMMVFLTTCRYGTGNLQRKAAHSQYWITTKVMIYIVVYVWELSVHGAQNPL